MTETTNDAEAAFLAPLVDKPWLSPSEPQGELMLAMSGPEIEWRARDLVRRTEARIAKWLLENAQLQDRMGRRELACALTYAAQMIERGDHRA